MSAGELRLGVVGLDGHGPVFIEQLNGSACPVPGMKVTVAMPVPSVMITERQLAENVESIAGHGVRIVDNPSELADQVDGILILHDDGSKHYELAELFADKGKPLFVDKPLEASTARAAELVALCRKHECPLFTASSLRFSREIQAVSENDAGGAVISAMVYSPYMERPTMPGWIYYAIHAVEPLYQLMGTGCREVRCITGPYGPVATGIWQDGRTGIAGAVAGGHHGYGFTVWRELMTEVVQVDIDLIYQELLKKIKEFFVTGVSPVAPEDSLEVMAFMEAANESMARDGAAVAVSS